MNKFAASCTVFLLLSSSAMAAEPCASDFHSFLSKFESSQEFRNQNTRFPLAATYVDSAAMPEPKTVAYQISGVSDKQYARAIYPSKAKQAATPFEAHVTSQQNHFLVQFNKPDTDYSFVFVFKKTSACWQLVKFEDYSL